MKNTPSPEPHSATPNRNWKIEQLTAYVKERFKDRDEMTEHLAVIGRKSAVELFRAGHALHFIKDKLKADSGYVQWLEDNRIARTTAHEAVKLYYKAKTEKKVEELTITQAKVKFGIAKPKKKIPKLGVPKVEKERAAVEPQEDHPETPPRADTVLVVIAKKLEEVVRWDRTNLDARHIEQLAQQCIKLLDSFLLKKTAPSQRKSAKKGKRTHAA